MNPEKLAEAVARSVEAKLTSMRSGLGQLADAVVALEDRLRSLEGHAPPDALEVAQHTVCNAGFDELIRLQVALTVRQWLAENAPQGEPGPPGKPGAPGVGVAGALINREGRLLLTLSNGEACDVGPVVGRDAFRLEDFEADFDLETGLRLTFIDTVGVQKSVTVPLPIPVHRGFWREGMHAKAGEMFTHDGSTWVAKRPTSKKPATEYADDWTLAARKGRDARAKSAVAFT